MTPADLDRLEQIASAATPGPWGAGIEMEGLGLQILVYPGDGRAFTIGFVESWDRRAENAAFIAAAREAVPRLIAEVRRLTTQAEDDLGARLTYEQGEDAQRKRAEAAETKLADLIRVAGTQGEELVVARARAARLQGVLDVQAGETRCRHAVRAEAAEAEVERLRGAIRSFCAATRHDLGIDPAIPVATAIASGTKP